MASMAATVAGAAKGPPKMGLIGAVGCMTAAMGNWRRKAVASGLRPMTTESRGARLSANTGPSVRRGFVLVIGCWSTACGETSGATILIISITPTSSANALCGLCSGGSSHSGGPLCCIPDARPKVLDLSSSVELCATGMGSTPGQHPILQGPREGL